jgi:hypothetical protein
MGPAKTGRLSDLTIGLQGRGFNRLSGFKLLRIFEGTKASPQDKLISWRARANLSRSWGPHGCSEHVFLGR